MVNECLQLNRTFTTSFIDFLANWKLKKISITDVSITSVLCISIIAVNYILVCY